MPNSEKQGSGSKVPGGRSPSQFIDVRIKELGDWRGETLARVRELKGLKALVRATVDLNASEK